MTRRLLQLLDTIRDGKLAPADFTYVRAGFFPDAADAYRTALAKLGPLKKNQLLERAERGDDRIYLYQLTFADASRYMRVGLAPDDRISLFSLGSEP